MYQKTTLENGIRVVTESMPSVRSIAMGIIVDTGLCDEHPHKNGEAHMVEHLMFQGTPSRDAMQIARLMDEAGGRIGGFTTRDYTCYSATVLDDYRTYVIDLLGDILQNSLFQPEDVEREKEAILREIDGLNDFPVQKADTLLKAHAWIGHPLARPITGQPDTIHALTREDLFEFFTTRYVPDRLIIAAAGNLDHQDFVAQVQDAFWHCLGHNSPTASQRLEHTAGVAVAYMPVTQVYFSIGIQAYPYTHPDRYGVHILNKILGDGISSRLFRCIREGQGLVYDIGSAYHAYRDGGLLIIEGSTSPGNFQQVLNETLSILSRLINGYDPAQPEELLRAKNQIKGQHFIAAEETHTGMSRLATQELYFGRHISTAEIIERIDAIDLNQIETISKQSLAENLSKVTVAVVGPEVSEDYDTLVNDALKVCVH